jgi:hypothetical protein
MRYVCLQRGQGPSRRLVIPQLLDDAVVAEPTVAVEHEHGPHAALLWTAEIDRAPSYDAARLPLC